MRRTLLLLLIAMLAPALAGPTAPAVPPLAVISIDGLQPQLLRAPDRYGLRIPNLRRLVREGAYASGVRGVLPTLTYPSHVTLVTGVSPARHGILSNQPLDPLGHNGDGWYWYAEDIRVPTLWDVAQRAGLVSSNVDWPVTVGARIAHNIPQYWRASTADAVKLARVVASPGLVAEAERGVGRAYPVGYAYRVDDDRQRAAFSQYLLEHKRPRLHFCYFSGLDEEQHASGPASPRALAALEELDVLVGRVRASAERVGGGRALIAVVSDHGFRLTTREIHLNSALRAAGLLSVDGPGRPRDWRAFAWSAGGSAAVVVRDPQDAEARRRALGVVRSLAADPRSGVGRVMDAAAVRAAGGFTDDVVCVVGARPGFRFGARLDGPVLREAGPAGTHGMLPEDPAMDATFVIAGPGVPAARPLGRVEMTDIAPTLAARLGLKLPEAEGRDLLAIAPVRAKESR